MDRHLHQIQRALGYRIRQSVTHLRVLWLEMISADAPALVLATAFAVGTLLSMVPVPVVDMMLAALVMRLLRRLPRGPIVAAMALWNSFVMAPVYAYSPKVGSAFIATAANHSSLHLNDAMVQRLLVGNAVIAIGLALFSFLIAAMGFSVLRLQRAAEPART